VAEICEKLAGGELVKTPETITLQWYRELERWQGIVQGLSMYGGMLNLGEAANAARDGTVPPGGR